jgi:hypothetical protein
MLFLFFYLRFRDLLQCGFDFLIGLQLSEIYYTQNSNTLMLTCVTKVLIR